MSVARHPTLFEEAGSALAGTWLLLAGRGEARGYFDFSQRGLAGSFIPLVLACVTLVTFLGMGPADQSISAAMQVFVLGAIATLRYSALRVILPPLGASDAFRPYMVASNWASAIAVAAVMVLTFGVAFVAALILGPTSGETLVGLVLALWVAVAIAIVVIEINILRIVAGLGAGEIILALAVQLLAVLTGFALIGRLVQG